MDAAKSGMSYRKAPAAFGVPKSTIRDHVAGVVKEGSTPVRQPTFPPEVEDRMATKVKVVATCGFSITRLQLAAKAA